MSIFDKWNKEIDGDALKKDVKEAAENGGGNYEEVPYGTYEVKVDKMELKECGSEKHKGEPMISIWFKIIAGEKKGSLIFMNQLLTQGFQIHIVNELLRSMESGVDVEFDGNYEHYNNTILDVFEACANLEFVLKYSESKRGYPMFKIEDVFEA